MNTLPYEIKIKKLGKHVMYLVIITEENELVPSGQSHRGPIPNETSKL